MKRRRALLFSITLVLALCAACGWSLHRERQQYTLNRQLIAALKNADTNTALALLNSGADPNTRYDAPPAPSPQNLLNYLLHRKSLPPNDSPTAFLMACGMRWPVWRNGRSYWMAQEENLPLLDVMLAHGADVNTRATRNITALHNAVREGRPYTAEVLLKRNAPLDAPDTQGSTPLMMAVVSEHRDMAHLLLTYRRTRTDRTWRDAPCSILLCFSRALKGSCWT